MKFTIHAGHNPSGKIACGASDYLDESTEARFLVKKLKNNLTFTDCTVDNGTSQNDVLKKIVSKCNKVTNGMDISIHFNASSHEKKSDGKTVGVEAYVYNLNSKNGSVKLAEKLCETVSEFGFKNRGVKENKSLYFLKNTMKPAVLLEVCFVTDKDDSELWKKERNCIACRLAKTLKEFK